MGTDGGFQKRRSVLGCGMTDEIICGAVTILSDPSMQEI